jgi:aryl-alcohol dehydrogenase-like predicted oxidoreductase
LIERTDLAPGYSISRSINGGWQLSEGHVQGGYDQQAALESLRQLVETGLTTFDCADIYVGVEDLLGELGRLLANGSGLEIHTKFVPDRSSLTSLSRRDVERGIDRSLHRLGVEQLDLVQFHWWDYEVPGYLEAAGWLAEQQIAGKIRYLGTTNFDTDRLREIVDAGVPIVSNQLQYSLLDRRPESGMVAFCREQGIQLLCYGAVAGGFLSSRWVGMPDPRGSVANRSLTKYRLIIEEFGGWSLFQELLAAVSKIARRHEVSLTNVATRWVLDRPQVAAIMIGARSAAHLQDNLRVFNLRLDAADLELLDELLSRSRGPRGEPFELERIPGGRHSSIMKTNLNRQ